MDSNQNPRESCPTLIPWPSAPHFAYFVFIAIEVRFPSSHSQHHHNVFLRLQPFFEDMYEIQAKHEATFDALNLSLAQAQRYEARLKELGSRLPSADIRDALEKAVLPDHHIQGSSTATHHLTTLTHTN